ncbi:MAG: glycoside hydrolase [Sulfuricurvum sp. RIFCSPLOWO2_02_FULL_43_45]|nr:MAG: glycoside hydrolase [Sulfuricurvum sp. RIFCSPLOWO2_02_FULL_43_45]
MKKSSLNLSFFWHMHQPDYRGSDGVMRMPWVFLHAIKDYYEMPWLLSEYPGLKATFNLSASLIEQLHLYVEPLRFDYFLSLWALHPSKLEESQRNWVIKLITAMQFETMVRPIERYAELYYRDSFSDDELIDLEVVFILAWCGNYLRQHNKEVKRLLEQKRGFSQHDKETLLKSLSTFIAEILPLYASLQSQGIISVSTTPYFHPILPLLVDMQNAKRANETTVLPEGGYSLQEDAYEHVRLSIDLYERTFGRKPSGFWPAEGAVDEKSVEIYKEEGIKWIATDEAILYRSLQNDDPALRYKSYRFNDVLIGFRDHALSDLIGFEYRHRSGKNASRHFMGELETIALNHDNPNVFVIVDGENAWEFYPNNGFDFFQGLYGALRDTAWCHTLTMDEISMQSGTSALEYLHPGTWIHGTFDTWVGHREKNRAWELIFQTRREFERYKDGLSDEVKKQIKYHLLASECSDWFWWYGEDHNTNFAHEFDTLFRTHLIDIYKLLGLSVPETLLIPIISSESEKSAWIKPCNMISPQLNGEKRTFFDWMGCGYVDEQKIFGTMERSRGPINTLFYGFDAENLYVAFEGNIEGLEDISIEILIEESDKSLNLKPHSFENRLEFSFSRNHFLSNGSVHVRFKLKSGVKTLQSLPGFGSLKVDLTEDFTSDWYI